jgi:subtilisin family serine protease
MSSVPPDGPDAAHFDARRLPPGVAEAPGGEFFYRQGELLVTKSDLDRVRGLRAFLARRGVLPKQEQEVVVVRTEEDVLALLDDVEREFGPDTGVEPNYVFVGAQTLKGGPDDFVTPAAPPAPPWIDSKVGDGLNIGVLDTGVAFPIHPWLDGRLTADPAVDEDVPNRGGGHPPWLDLQGGHGTFVAGVLTKGAPAAHLLVARVLDAQGIGDVRAVRRGLARAIAAAQARPTGRLDALNLSFGGYTWRDRPPAVLRQPLAALAGQGTVIVAAAGNDATWRPFWPAAFDFVVGVAALDGRGPAPFTNFGPWVDACAPGVDVVSTFFDERPGPIPHVDLPPDLSSHAVTFPGYARWSGTSFAAPKVAAAIAAAASSWGIDVREAERRLIRDWQLNRVPDLGVVVNVA